jgi:hypothetical protein
VDRVRDCEDVGVSRSLVRTVVCTLKRYEFYILRYSNSDYQLSQVSIYAQFEIPDLGIISPSCRGSLRRS